MERILKTTQDGSHTLYVPELNEHYHSIHGALQESLHVFIASGLSVVDKDPIAILEVGLGTGLNALLTFRETVTTGRQVHYTTYEQFPLDKQEVAALNYTALLANSQTELEQLHEAPWEQSTRLSAHFTILKHQADITQATLSGSFDLVYFDAFAPEKQPELWTLEVFQKIANSMIPGGLLVTYCAKGAVKRTLKAVGLQVEGIPGPPGKREMIRACRAF